MSHHIKFSPEDIDVSVYIVSRNYGSYLSESIESVLTQTFRRWELILIDDGSEDDSIEVMKLYASDPRIRIYSAGGIGLPAVCNLAIRESRGKYLIRLDADDFLDENALLVLVNAMDANDDLAFVFPDYYLINENGLITSHERREKLVTKNHLLDIPPNGACTLIRKSVLNAIGGYREDLGAQDGLDLWVKVRDKYPIKNINLPLFYYRRHGENLTNSPYRILSARRHIKKDWVTKNIDSQIPVIAVIPCRRRYDFCENLWSVELGGVSLLEIQIRKCLSSSYFNKVVVVSDTDEVLSVIGKFQDKRLNFLHRDSEKTIRSVSIVESLREIVHEFDPEGIGILVMGYVPSPFVSIESMEEAIATLLFNDADSSMGVEVVREPVYKRTSFGLAQVNPSPGYVSDFSQLYKDANIALAVRSKTVKYGSLTGARSVSFIVDSSECFFVDSYKKLEIAKIMESKG